MGTHQMSFWNDDITLEEVISATDKWKVKKAAGVDEIPNQVSKYQVFSVC